MADKNTFNKTSQYVKSLSDFIVDTKPYHSKLTSVIEEYHFSDNVNVQIDERLIIRAKLDSHWHYNYYSSANAALRTLPLHRVVEPAFFTTTHLVGTDENKDMASVPGVYSKATFDHVGVNAVYVRRANGVAEPLTETVDYFEGHGSFQFQIKQTMNAANVFDPRWSATNDDGVIAAATLRTRVLALDTVSPSSAVNRVKALLDEIQVAVAGVAGNFTLQEELNSLYATTAVPDLPRSYEGLLNYLDINAAVKALLPRPVRDLNISDGSDPSYEGLFQGLSSPLYFGMFTDMGIRESGLVVYENVQTPHLSITNIVPDVNGSGEEWTLTSMDDNTSQWSVVGSTSGFVGFTTAGDPFNTSKISFNSTPVSQPPIGEKIFIDSKHKVVVHKNAPLETWNIIKVNSIAHSRASLISTGYGKIQDLSGAIGRVTLLDPTLATSDIILEARADGVTFDLTSTEDLNHQGVVTANLLFNDGRVGFTIVSGSMPFHAGDKFIISVENLPAQAHNVDLGYGYDLDAYDNDHLEYPDGSKISFHYDGRFIDYDMGALELEVAQAAVNGRKWRVRARSSGAPISTIKKDGSGPVHQVDLMDATSGAGPDPASNSVPVYSMAGDANAAPDLELYYATDFAVEYSDNDFKNTTTIGTVAVGNTFQSVVHGIKFKLAPASKPFIAALSDDGLNQPRVEGGDVFSFQVTNPFPTLVEKPIGLVSAFIPRLNLYSDSFYETIPARWTVQFSSPTSYTVSGIQTGENVGQPVLSTPTAELLLAENHSFKQLGVHFTIVPGPGLFAGDTFTFETFEDKPSYLVHGSVTGWTPPATVGQYYWNGKIGFKITKPQRHIYIDGTEVTEVDANTFVTRLREDTPSLTYILAATVNGGYMVTRTDVGILGRVGSTGTFSDRYITFNTIGASATEIKIDINSHDYPLFNAQDVVIIKPRVAARLPKTGDRVIIEKTQAGRLAISLTPVPGLNVTELAPITIDQRFIDLNTANGLVPLSATSPETAILQGWLPMVQTPLDAPTSVAEFSDPATRIRYTSAASGETIGMVRAQGTNVNEPILFEWDSSFFTKYLPLNAEANLVVTGSGWNDKTRVHMTESIKFLIGGGALFENWLFNDVARVNFLETPLFKLTSSYGNSLSVDVNDTFGSFMAGYDNLEYDNEPNGYDEGFPPDLYSLLAKHDLSDDEYVSIIKQWGFFLNSSIPPTTEQQWAYVRSKIALDPNPGLTTTAFGLPAQGFGLDILQKSSDGSTASIQEAMVIVANDLANGYDANGYDVAPLDLQSETTALMYTGSLPPVPQTVPLGTTYDSLDTPLNSLIPVRVFEITFSGTAVQLNALSPTFRIWLPASAAAQVVPANLVEKISAGKYRFSIPQAAAAKIIVG